MTRALWGEALPCASPHVAPTSFSRGDRRLPARRAVRRESPTVFCPPGGGHPSIVCPLVSFQRPVGCCTAALDRFGLGASGSQRPNTVTNAGKYSSVATELSSMIAAMNAPTVM